MTENDSSLFSVDIENYNGPLDILLDLAKSQKVNLENISITKLADQFHDFITNQKNFLAANICNLTKFHSGIRPWKFNIQVLVFCFNEEISTYF